MTQTTITVRVEERNRGGLVTEIKNRFLFSIVAMLATFLVPIGALASSYQGSGYPYTQVVEGSLSVEQCPSGFQGANGLIVDTSTGNRYTECWPEAAWAAWVIGGSTWQAFKDSGGTMSLDELRSIQQLWRDYYKSIQDAQELAAEESRLWNQAHPGQQKCVQWGPIVAPDGIGESGGGVCANAYPAEGPSSSDSFSESATTSPSESIEITVQEEIVSSSQTLTQTESPVNQPEMNVAPQPQAPLTDGTYERICLVMGWSSCAEWRINNSAGAEVNRVIGPYPEASLRSVCGSGLCGGGTGGTVELIRMVSASVEAVETAPPVTVEPTPSSSSSLRTSSDSVSQKDAVTTSPAPSELQSTPTVPTEPAPTQTSELGGYAVVHPQTGVVCGVIVATGPLVMSGEYMGCPAGSQAIFQTFPSETGNVAGYHGPDVIYRNGTFYLSWGTITDGIATDLNGRIWHTGNGSVIREGSLPSNPSNTSSDSVTVSSEITSSSQSQTTSSGVTNSQTASASVSVSTSPVVSQSTSISNSLTVTSSSTVAAVSSSASSSTAAAITQSDLASTSSSESPIATTSEAANVSLSPRSSIAEEISPGSTLSEVVSESAEPTFSAQITKSTDVQIAESNISPQIVIGTFQGRWAVRISSLDATVISIRAGGNWYKIESEDSRVFFSRKSIVGTQLPVAIWIDGQLTLEQSIVIVP